MNSDKVSVQSYVSQRQKLAKFTNQTKLNKFFFWPFTAYLLYLSDWNGCMNFNKLTTKSKVKDFKNHLW